MDSFEASLGVPGTKLIDSIHDRQQSNRQKQQKRKQKTVKDKINKTDLQDSVKISVNESEERSTSERNNEKKPLRSKGDFIDIQA